MTPTFEALAAIEAADGADHALLGAITVVVPRISAAPQVVWRCPCGISGAWGGTKRNVISDAAVVLAGFHRRHQGHVLK